MFKRLLSLSKFEYEFCKFFARTDYEMELSFFWINLVFIFRFDFGYCADLPCNKPEEGMSLEKHHEVALQERFEVSFSYNNDVKNVTLEVFGHFEAFKTSRVPVFYFKKITFDTSTKALTDKPSDWKKKGQYTVTPDNNQVKLNFEVGCTDHEIQIKGYYYFYKCSSYNVTVVETHFLSVKELGITEKRHRFLSALKLVVNFNMCPAVVYTSIKVDGFGKQESITVSYDVSNVRSKSVTIIYESYGQNCLYDDSKVTFSFVFTDRVETYIVSLKNPNCYTNSMTGYLVFLLFIMSLFLFGFGPVLMARKGWYKTARELDLLKSQSNHETIKISKTEKSEA